MYRYNCFSNVSRISHYCFFLSATETQINLATPTYLSYGCMEEWLEGCTVWKMDLCDIGARVLQVNQRHSPSQESIFVCLWISIVYKYHYGKVVIQSTDIYASHI